ncbi:flagellar protein FliT [Burkholderia sp. Bp9143]|uniref:flagellar protein FliT n=1 Tax=Burkholderia sp. Bp9143 TaxID=2184574 RepID=UPI000F5B174A|nr:flagellar protein FliT [Burkholderia sp. Bp9143]RQR26938.1 flagellar protein FliT [Burkholderia sp. Bp9143]
MDQATLIERLTSLTRAIEHAASMADWPEAARLAEARSPLFAMLTSTQDPAVLDAIRKIQAADAAVFANAQITRTELSAEYQEALGRVSSVSQYQQVAQI